MDSLRGRIRGVNIITGRKPLRRKDLRRAGRDAIDVTPLLVTTYGVFYYLWFFLKFPLDYVDNYCILIETTTQHGARYEILRSKRQN